MKMLKSVIFAREILETNISKIKKIEKSEIIVIIRRKIEVLHITYVI